MLRRRSTPPPPHATPPPSLPTHPLNPSRSTSRQHVASHRVVSRLVSSHRVSLRRPVSPAFSSLANSSLFLSRLHYTAPPIDCSSNSTTYREIKFVFADMLLSCMCGIFPFRLANLDKTAVETGRGAKRRAKRGSSIVEERKKKQQNRRINEKRKETNTHCCYVGCKRYARAKVR